MRLSTINETETIPLAGHPEYTGATTTLNLEELPDEELVRAFVRDRDEEAFDEIVNRYRDKVYGIALRITHNPSEAEDVMQEVFITLVEKLDTFREESKFSTWLYRVTVNAGYIRTKSEQRKRENEVRIEDYAPYNESGVLEGIQTKDWSDRPDELLLKQEGVGIIEKAVNELPAAYRIVFHLRDVEELSNQEVANILGLSLTAVKSRIHRARLFLRDKLSDYFYESGK